MPSIQERFRRAWNAFANKDPTGALANPLGATYSSRPDRSSLIRGNDRSIINTVITRIAIDVAAIPIIHCKVDGDDRYVQTIKDELNDRLTFSANLDQTGREFIQDIVMTMLDDGTACVCPIDTEGDPRYDDAYTIESWRVGHILEWKANSVKVRVYDERDAQKKELIFPKRSVAIINNPLYSIMNEPNSTARRLASKLNLLDIVEEKSGSDKLDLIINLPYAVRTEAKRAQVNKRKEDIEWQLANSKYGIAYLDATEHVTQLNRSVENNLLKSVEYWTHQLLSQLGMTEKVFDGTADEKEMLNYYNRTCEPILANISDEMIRKFLSKTARTQGHRVKYFRDPFRLIDMNQVAEIADKFTRNEIATPNEIRQFIGMKPSKDPKADVLSNRNINQAANQQMVNEQTGEIIQNGTEKAAPEQQGDAPVNEKNAQQTLNSVMDIIQKYQDMPI